MKGYVKHAVWSMVESVRNGEAIPAEKLDAVATEYGWTESEKADFRITFPHIAVVLTVKGTVKNGDVRVVRTEKGESVCRKYVENYAAIVRENRTETIRQKDCKNHGTEKAEKASKPRGFAGTILQMTEEARKAIADAIARGDSNAVAVALKKARESATVKTA